MGLLNSPFTATSSSPINLDLTATLLNLYVIYFQVLSSPYSNLNFNNESFAKYHENPPAVS